MIFVKKEISRIANGVLFDPNVQTTWDRFTAAANPFLTDVKARFGLTDFRVVLDSSTTTPDLVDRNILYAKIFLKPARAIEFIALDFVITRTGASFGRLRKKDSKALFKCKENIEDAILEFWKSRT